MSSFFVGGGDRGGAGWVLVVLVSGICFEATVYVDKEDHVTREPCKVVPSMVGSRHLQRNSVEMKLIETS